ncbi:MAG: DUF481 domain-containing protein [Flavobacteriales bacterium]|nr:MAG: DUF481 domain-containing protein [Flavobacteriales bacterium]
MDKHIFGFIIFYLSFLSASAQFSDTTSHHLKLVAAGSINKTNTDKAYLLNNSLNYGIKRKSIVLNSSNTWLYGKQNSELSNNDFSSTLNFNLYKTIPHFYYWGLLNYNTSYSLKINHQLLAGLGVAYNILDRENVYLNISNGVLYDQSNLLSNEIYNTYRNSFRIQYRFVFKELIIFEGSNFIQSSFERKGDHIFRSANSLGIKLRKWISLNTTLNYNKLNITNRENLNLTYGITLDNYF